MKILKETKLDEAGIQVVKTSLQIKNKPVSINIRKNNNLIVLSILGAMPGISIAELDNEQAKSLIDALKSFL